MSLQLKNAKQMQLAAEAARRREEEILRAKAENQQQSKDVDEQIGVELRTDVDVHRPPESAERSTVTEKRETSGDVSVEQSTATDADQDTSVQREEASCCAEQVTAEINTEASSGVTVQDEVEANQTLPDTDHRETLTESATEMQYSESSDKHENQESETTAVDEEMPVVVVASGDGEITRTELSSQNYVAEDKEIGQEQSEELTTKTQSSDQLMTDADKTKLEITDDVMRSVSDESSDAYTDVLEDETDHLSDILEVQDITKWKEDIEYVELCDESSSTVEPNANKEDNKEETEKELDSILDDVHLDESEHGI